MKFGEPRGGRSTFLSKETVSKTQRGGQRSIMGTSIYCLKYSRYWARQFAHII